MSGTITLELTKDQALVLFEWLARSDETLTLPTEHQAEQIVLWILEGKLENALAAQFSRPDYKRILAEAWDRIVAEKVSNEEGEG